MQTDCNWGAMFASLLAISTTAVAGDGPFLEISVLASSDRPSGLPQSDLELRFVVDTSQSVVPSLMFIGFDTESFEAAVQSRPNTTAPVIVVDDSVQFVRTEFTSSITNYRVTNGFDQIRLFGNNGFDSETGETLTFDLRLSNPGPAFNSEMTVLPSDPNEWVPSITGSSNFDPIELTWNYNGTGYSASWSPAIQEGSVAVSYRLIEDPTSDCLADLAPPIGSLDFTDVIVFLASFGAGCP